MTGDIIEVVGWAGAVILLVAYALLTRGTIAVDSGRYVGLNLVGSGALLLNGAYHAAWPSAVLNLLWLAIGGFGYVTARRQLPPRLVEPAEPAGSTTA